jgi:hypothetical protein
LAVAGNPEVEMAGRQMWLAVQDTFVGIRAETWVGWGIWVMLVLYILIAGVVISQLGDAKRLRLWQTRPYVVVDVEFENHLVVLTIRSTGQTAAANVVVRFNERVRSSVGHLSLDWQDSAIFTDGMGLMAPGRELRYAIDAHPERQQSGMPMTLRGSVTYGGHNGRQTYREAFAVDLSDYSGSIAMRKGLPELVDTMDSLRESLTDVAAAAGAYFVSTERRDDQHVTSTALVPVASPPDSGPMASGWVGIVARSQQAFTRLGRALRNE